MNFADQTNSDQLGRKRVAQDPDEIKSSGEMRRTEKTYNFRAVRIPTHAQVWWRCGGDVAERLCRHPL
jgi:hypothetical protein